ncbi:MAG: TIGR02996 domain-containing protein [Planctomycetes bacterium]|nr:TIGR02996 domain-containing protein [Planctomycetota bacterium]
MTCEDDFQRALDADPGDWQTRLVFADWLEEQGDARAEGYRALGRQRARPILIQMQSDDRNRPGAHLHIYGTAANNSEAAQRRWGGCFLDAVWFKRLPRANETDRNQWWRYYPTRRAAEDGAARAFAKLGKVRRARLLRPVAVEPPPAPPVGDRA